ncbi:MAG: hypothetical protein KAQ66_02120 [Rhodospirillaceae bacterium]|nr:hypothetical protein [Rhodospirillaceae bacterium]
MNDIAFELLDWARGPGLEITSVLFVLGIALRLGELAFIGRKPNLAPARGSAFAQGIKTIFTRTAPAPGMVKRAPAIHIGGWVFHIGFFIVVLFYSSHIRVFDDWFNVPWTRWPSSTIANITIITMIALVVLLVTRIAHPVRRRISNMGDYAAWALTFLPLVTGYISAHDLTDAPIIMKALHILSAELLMVAFPFTKLMHGITTFVARYYNGAIQGHKGAKS